MREKKSSNYRYLDSWKIDNYRESIQEKTQRTDTKCDLFLHFRCINNIFAGYSYRLRGYGELGGWIEDIENPPRQN